jgi:nucleoside-diphosphate-sugar epimerase
MKLLITGATGFIGGNLAKRLSKNTQYSIVVTGRSVSINERFQDLPIAVVQGDLVDQTFAYRAMKNIDIVVHCAGLAGTWGEYEEYYRANVLVTDNLIRAAQKNKVKRFINISSPSIYLNFTHQLNIDESYLPATFSNHYARTKYEAEQLVHQAHTATFQTISLRPRMVIGAGDNNLIPRLLTLQESGLLKQIGHGENLVDFTSVNNLLDLIENCFSVSEVAMGRAYNISNGHPDKFWEVVDTLCVSLNISSQRKKLPYSLVMGLAKLNEKVCTVLKLKKEPRLLPVPVSVLANSMTLNIDAAKQLLAYKPTQTTQQAMQDFLAWREHK